MTRTVAQRMQAALEARGWIVDADHRSSKYVAMRPTPAVKFFFVGAGGSRTYVTYDEAKYGMRRYFISTSTLRYSADGKATTAYQRAKFKHKLLQEMPQ